MQHRCRTSPDNTLDIFFVLSQCARVFCCVLLALVISSLPAQAKAQSLEYKIKAAYLYNFSKFTRWPDQTTLNSTQSFQICILGRDPFGSVITPIENKTINGQQIKLLYLAKIDDQVKNCRIVFISEHNPQQVQSILLALSETSILTVGESNDFASSGGIIGFVIKNGHVQLQINKTAASHARLKFDPRLLKLGKSVKANNN